MRLAVSSNQKPTPCTEQLNLLIWSDAALAVCLSVLWGFAYLFIQTNGFDLPPSYRDDGLWYGMIALNLAQGNNWAETARLGAPFGQALWDFPYFYWAHLSLLKGSLFLTNNIFAALNLFVLISYGLVAFCAYPAFRIIGLRRILAITSSVVFSGLPYHFIRQGGHMFLASYYCIPLAFLATYIIALSDAHFKKKWLVIIGILCGGCGIYYAALTAWCILFAVIVEAREGTNLKARFWDSIIFLGALSLSVLINLIPHISFWVEQGSNSFAVIRSASEVENYGLRPINLLLPQERHLLYLLANLTGYYTRNAYFVNENMSASLGILGTTGFLLSISILLVIDLRKVIPAQGQWLARLNLWIMLFAVVGGIGTIIAYFISPYIRALNRFSVIIGFISLAILALAAQHQFDKKDFSSKKIIGIALFVIALAVADQTPQPNAEIRNNILNQFNSDRQFVGAVESILGNNLLNTESVLILPHIEFPEATPHYLEGFYAPLRFYLHSKKLRQSYGAIKGRLGDLWLKNLTELPLVQLVRDAASSGFQGIILFRQAIPPDKRAMLEDELQQLLGKPTTESILKDLVFYKFQPHNNKNNKTPTPLILNPSLGRGWYGWESNTTDRWAWSMGDAELKIGHTFDHPITLSLNFKLFSLQPRLVTILLGKDQTPIANLRIEATKKEVYCYLEVTPGIQTISMRTDKPAISPQTKDRRLLAFAIENLTLTKPLSASPGSCQKGIQIPPLNN